MLSCGPPPLPTLARVRKGCCTNLQLGVCLIKAASWVALKMPCNEGARHALPAGKTPAFNTVFQALELVRAVVNKIQEELGLPQNEAWDPLVQGVSCLRESGAVLTAAIGNVGRCWAGRGAVSLGQHTTLAYWCH